MKTTRERIEAYIDALDPAGLGVIPEGLTYTLTMDQLVYLVNLPREAEMNDTKEREQFEAWRNSDADPSAGCDSNEDYWIAGFQSGVESQAAELAEANDEILRIHKEKVDRFVRAVTAEADLAKAQAKVVAWVELIAKYWKHLPPQMHKESDAIALASTDAPKLREKYYEECAVICEQGKFRLRHMGDLDAAYGEVHTPKQACVALADAIRAAAKKESK